MTNTDTLHRGAKIFMDAGTAETHEEAMAILMSFGLNCLVGLEIISSPTLQAALLTAVNLANRSFLGGVTVHGIDVTTPNRTHLPGGTTLAEAVAFWGGRLTDAEPSNAPALVFGSAQAEVNYPLALRVTFDGWRAAVSPLRDAFRLGEREVLPTAGIVAAALGVSEAFQHLCGNAEAMRRTIGISLWDPQKVDIRTGASEPDAANTLLPQKAWLLGLGHLGQAYLWTLMALPYAVPEKVTLVLHDFDKAIEANLSTSVLTTRQNIGVHKTRFLADLAQARGYQSIIQERPFDERLQIGPGDPALLLCGVDSAHVRRQIGGAGFPEIIEAGIGNAEDYLDYQIHSFPAARFPDELLLLPAYKKMQESSENQCGLVQIADVSVGVPFVGAFVSGLVVAEAIRAAMMGPRNEIVDGSLSTPCQRAALARGANLLGSSLGFVTMS